MKIKNFIVLFILLFIFQNYSAQEIDLKVKAKELGYKHIIKYYHDTYLIYKNDLIGLLNQNFKILLPPKYSISFKEGDDFLRLKNTEDYYSLYNMKENKMIFENVPWISNSFELIKNNQKILFFEVNNNGTRSLYSSEGKLLTNLTDNYSVTSHGGPSVGVIVLSNGKNFLIIDDTGKKIVEYAYIFQPFDSQDFFIVRDDNYVNGETHMKYGIINHGGKFIYNLIYDKIFSEKEFVILRKDKKIDILNKNLKPIIIEKPGVYAEVVEDNFFLIETPSKSWQLYDLFGSLVMEQKANKMQYYGKKLFRITTDKNEIYFIDINGIKVPHMEKQ
jgi:hypothetical protein